MQTIALFSVVKSIMFQLETTFFPGKFHESTIVFYHFCPFFPVFPRKPPQLQLPGAGCPDARGSAERSAAHGGSAHGEVGGGDADGWGQVKHTEMVRWEIRQESHAKPYSWGIPKKT